MSLLPPHKQYNRNRFYRVSCRLGPLCSLASSIANTSYVLCILRHYRERSQPNLSDLGTRIAKLTEMQVALFITIENLPCYLVSLVLHRHVLLKLLVAEQALDTFLEPFARVLSRSEPTGYPSSKVLLPEHVFGELFILCDTFRDSHSHLSEHKSDQTSSTRSSDKLENILRMQFAEFLAEALVDLIHQSLEDE